MLSKYSLDTDFDPPVCLNNFDVRDGGDIALINGDVEKHYADIESAVRFAISRDSVPVIIGGDDGITNPVLRGLDALSDITLIQIDAHLDWCDKRFEERDGFSSPMRRASELPFINEIHQIGIRSFGSAQQSEWDSAIEYGANIHLARDVHKYGLSPVQESLPQSGNFFINLDIDGFDPSVMPGTIALSPGGLTWWQVVDLFEMIANRGTILGLNIVEFAPKNDLNQLSSIGIGRLILKFLMLQLVNK